MKKLLLLAAIILFLPGCMGGASKMIASQKELMAQIPDHTFSKFEYHRAGMYSSAHIIAKDAIKVGGAVEVGSISMTLNYGPESLVISVDGYSHVIPEKEE